MNLRAERNKAKKARAVRVHFYSYVRPSVYIRLLLCCFVRRRRRHLPQLPDVWFSLSLPSLLFHLRCPTFFWVAHSCCRDTLGRAAKHYLLSTICPAVLSNHMWRNRRPGSACGFGWRSLPAPARCALVAGEGIFWWRRHEPNWTGRRKRKRENMRRGR